MKALKTADQVSCFDAGFIAPVPTDAWRCPRQRPRTIDAGPGRAVA
ncbi:hypothetical protein SALB1_1188 [Salinisphaera sp. LB1]|nr:hypothetical protein SALB1_1188 [Salinisphaera sp. LB1]